MNFDRSLLEFKPRNHGHYYQGKRLLGVTTALSSISKGDAIVQWAANQACDYARQELHSRVYNDENDCLQISLCPEEIETILLGAKHAWRDTKDKAATIGTLAHNWIESYLKGETPDWPDDPNARNSCEAALKWIESVHWETIKIEHQVYIPELGVAGICDWYAKINGVLSVPDWKTSKSLHSVYAYQTAAYLKALEAEFGEKIPHRWLIRIDKETGEVEPRFLPEETIERDYNAFVNAVGLYRSEAAIKKEWGN